MTYNWICYVNKHVLAISVWNFKCSFVHLTYPFHHIHYPALLVVVCTCLSDLWWVWKDMQLVIRALVLELCKFGGCDWVTVSGEFWCTRQDGTGMKRVLYWVRIYMWLLLSHLMYVKCAVRMLTDILIQAWEESVTVPSFIPINYLPVLSPVKINRCIQMEAVAHVLWSCVNSLSMKEHLLWYFVAPLPSIKGKSVGFWDHHAVCVSVCMHARVLCACMHNSYLLLNY